MEEQAVLERYRLALALIPDEDAAGELFMRAPNEAALLRLAARWRERQGLEPLDPPALLPELDPFQVEHALHLHRRGRFRRRSLTALSLALPVAAVAALALFWPGLQARQALPAAFQREPVQVAQLEQGLRLAVYQVLAEPGQVTVWWELAGRGSLDPGSRSEPILTLPALDQGLRPRQTEWTEAGRSRLLARSTYSLQVTTASSVLLRWALPGQPAERVLELPLQKAPVGEVRIPVRQESSGPYPVWVEAVGLSATATRVYYRAAEPPGGTPGVPSEIRVRSYRLRSVTGEMGDGGLRVMVYPPIPDGATELTLHFAAPSERLGPVVYPLPAPGVVSPVNWLGDRAYALFRPEPNQIARINEGQLPYFTDREGRRWETLENPPQAWDGVIQYSLVVLDPPRDVEFVSLTIPVMERYHPLRPLWISLVPHTALP
ncbi:MAG: hypothetical protein ACOY93_23195 [Bacillota bacterium]